MNGIAASSGIAVAKAFKLEMPEIVIEKKTANCEEEIEKFQKEILEL